MISQSGVFGGQGDVSAKPGKPTLAVISLVAAVLALCATLTAVAGTYLRPGVSAGDLKAINERLDRLSGELEQVRQASAQQQELLKKAPSSNPGAALEQNRQALAALRSDQEGLKQRLEGLSRDVQ